MKTTHRNTIAAVCSAVLIFNFSGCKYPDGPKISLKSKKARLTGDWDVDKLAGDKTDGDVSMEFDKDGDGEFSYYGETYDFEWEFAHDKEDLEVTMDLGGYYNYTYTFDFEIQRLTNKEMVLEDEDNDEWELSKK